MGRGRSDGTEVEDVGSEIENEVREFLNDGQQDEDLNEIENSDAYKREGILCFGYGTYCCKLDMHCFI